MGFLGANNILSIKQDKDSPSSPMTSLVFGLTFCTWPYDSPSTKLACHIFVRSLDLCPFCKQRKYLIGFGFA